MSASSHTCRQDPCFERLGGLEQRVRGLVRGLQERIPRRLRAFSIRCLLMGHDDLVRRESERMYLECTDCGRATRGWMLGRGRQRTSRRVVCVRGCAHEFAAAA